MGRAHAAGAATTKPGGKKEKGLTLVGLDFETYYDDDYTLKKLSTSEYVRDPRFETLSVAMEIDGVPTVHFGDDIRTALDAIDWSHAELLCHHTHFDGLILSHHYGHVPAKYRDTLSMGRALHPKSQRNRLEDVAVHYGVTNKLTKPNFKGKRSKDLSDEDRVALAQYNATDVRAMMEIYEKMLPSMPEKEMELIHLTVRMFADPILELDTVLAKKELNREIRERKTATSKSGALKLAQSMEAVVKVKEATDEAVLSSNKAFPELLRHLGVEPPRKTSKTTGKETYALSKADEEFTDLLTHPDQRVVALVRGRLAAKSTIGETRAARLLRSGEGGKRLPVYLNYCGAHTTRWSGGDKLNYQNLKKKGNIRRAIKAPEGYQLVVIDSSTIEVRVLAWLAQEAWLLDAFRQGADPYLIFGSEVYGYPINKKDHPLERFISKSCVLGLGYQMGGPKLQTSILAGSIQQGLDPVRLELAVCYSLVSKYRGKNRNIEKFWEFMNDTVIWDMMKSKPGVVHSHPVLPIEWGKGWMGLKDHLRLRYPEIRAHVSKPVASGWSRKKDSAPSVSDASYLSAAGRTKIYGGLATENLDQYIARMVVAEQMLQIAERYRVVMMTHDEVVFLAKTEEADEALKWGLEVMKRAPDWAAGLPVSAEGGYDSVYSK